MQNIEDLVITLRNAASQQAANIKPAEQALKDSEDKEGFHFALLKVSLSSKLNLEIHVRWLAVLYLKNGIERHWRTHGPSPISDAEKSSIRNELLSCFDEDVQQVALQFAVIVSKIARYDYPKSWPQLLHIIVSAIEVMQASSMEQRNNTIILTFRYVMKELGSKRLPNDRKLFTQLCCNCYPCIFSAFEKFSKVTMDMLYSSNENKNVVLLAEKLMNLLKALRNMSPVLSIATNLEFFKTILTSMKTLLGFATAQHLNCCNVQEKFHKLLLIHSKILYDALEMNNKEIYGFANDVLSICKQCIFLFSENRTIFQERFIVNCMNLIKLLVGTNDSERLCLVSMEDMQELMRCLVFSFMPLNSMDLESWADDVEEFCSEEIGETWKYNLRPSTEVLFLTFLHQCPEQLVPIVLATLNTVNENSKQNQVDPNVDLKSILVNDAVYTATGLAANELFDQLDFESWFVTYLLPYVQRCLQYPDGKIIHRRVLWLIQQWMGVKPPNEIRSILYDFIISSLNANLDMAVRLAASSALRQILDDFEFDIDAFLPFREKCSDGLFHLLQDAESGDSKMRVLHVLSFVIERLGTKVVTCAQKLAEILPVIWQVSDSHNMLRCAVVTTLTNLVVGLKENSSSMHPFLLNVIHASTDISSPAHIYLLADGLDLWIAVLQNTNEMTESLVHLFYNVYGLFELSSESIKESLEIVECYIILGGRSFLAGVHGAKLSASLLSLITDVRDECLILVSHLIELAIQVVPMEVPSIFEQYLCDTIQHVLDDGTTSILAKSRILVVARLAINNLPGFWHLFKLRIGQRCEEALLTLTKLFTDKIDCVVETEQRKAVALACLHFLDLFTSSEVLQNALSHVLHICLQVLYDVCDEDNIDTVVITANTTDTVTYSEWDNFHSIRMRLLMNSTPTHTISLALLVRQKLEKLSGLCGGVENLKKNLSSIIEQNILNELQNFL